MKKVNYNKLMFLGMIAIFLMGGNLYAQEDRTVTGKVFPAGMETPMQDVQVFVEGNMLSSVLTDANGFFSLEVPAFPVNLVFIRANYQEQVVEVKKAGDISVYLSAMKAVKNDYGQEVGMRVTLNPESRDGILMFSSTDKQFKYWFDNRVYIDGAAYFGDNTYQGVEHQIGNGVNIRRMRFAMKAIIWGNWGGEIDFDFGNNAVDIKDAYIRYIGKNWQVKAGHFREPMSLETLTTSRYITFLERPSSVEQAPSRHMGIAYKTFRKNLFFEGGIFSSALVNDLMRDQNKSKGTNAGWSLTGRVAYAPIKKDKEVLHLGISWLLNNADYYYNMSDAEFSQIDFHDINKGAFEVALRYSYMNANSFKDGELIPYMPGGAGETYTIGFNYHVNYNVKFMINYAYVNHDRWADGKGAHTTDEIDPLPTGEAGIDFSTLQARILIAF
jgi:phosphate-selective porin